MRVNAEGDKRPRRWRCSAAAPSAARWCGCCTSRPTTWPPGSARRWSWSASPCAASTRRATSTCPRELFTTDALGLVKRDDVDVVVEVVGGIEPARSLILAALERRVGGDRQQGAARRGRRDAARGRREAGRDLYYEAPVAGAIPLLRPLRESLPGDRITRVTGIVNGTTNFILGDGRHRRRLRRGAGGGAGAGVRRGRPDRRRRGLRRRGQGRDPGLAGVPHPGHRRRRVPRGHHRGHRRRRGQRSEMGCMVKLLASASSASDRRETIGRGPGAPGDDPAQPPAGQRRRRVQRGVRRGRGRRAADVLRPRRRRRADRAARCSATSSRWPATGSAGTRGAGESAYADRAIAADGRDRHPLPRRLDVADRAGVLAAVAERSPSTTCRSRPSARRAAATTRCW